ncbi:capsular biosynthesis protein CpsI [Chryseobacterium sp. Leaf405]|uniref:glycosyltransferase family 2 protein n=1 Tax=Chryseobacterium sp. Leaf405 TaxID=1736367 RepID=UPI0006F6C272|nr:glycosyltransferase family 2 protein [Chryseobacterium sp. Leaf405]KQT22979.1 capsular biosynthesis protein CpsI [Chryseobacterium sp. Leaf405]
MEISVIIPVYNAGQFLEKSVESAVHFDEVKEIILVEDKSTDNSLEICQKLASENPKIKLFQHPDKGNYGAGATRNLGLEKVTGNFITFLDADDYYLPNRFDAEKKLFEDPKIDGVFGAIGIEYLTEKGKQEYQSKFKDSSLTTVNYHAEGQEVFRGLLSLSTKTFGTFFHLNALTIRRSAIEKHKLRFNENLRVHQDSDFIIKLAYHCYLKSGIIDEAIAIRGIHDDNRITKIIQYSPQYNQRQLLYWTSLNDWANQNRLSSEERKRIYLTYKSFDLSQKKGLLKYFSIALEGIKNPEILKTKYRFNYYK